MKETIIIKLPYPVRVGFISFALPRKIGFSFNNLSFLQFIENNNLKDGKDLEAWTKKHGESVLMSQMMYAAAQAYCLQNYTKPNFTQLKLGKAIINADEKTQTEIIKAWNHSKVFGFKDVPGKKKVKRKH